MSGFDFWKAFLPNTSPLEIVIRGTIVYLFIFLLLRVVLKRQSGSFSMNDLLVLVLIADASQNAMAGNYQSIADGLLLVATIVFWSYFVDWLGYHFKWIEHFIEPPPLLLIKDGNLQRRNMRRELITTSELLTHLREQGIDDICRVKEAYMEADGSFSVVSRDAPAGGHKTDNRRTQL